VHAIVQAYRQARDRGESELMAFNAAADTALALGRPLDKINDTARVLIDWASRSGGGGPESSQRGKDEPVAHRQAEGLPAACPGSRRL